jgi:hypothetical protein
VATIRYCVVRSAPEWAAAPELRRKELFLRRDEEEAKRWLPWHQGVLNDEDSPGQGVCDEADRPRTQHSLFEAVGIHHGSRYPLTECGEVWATGEQSVSHGWIDGASVVAEWIGESAPFELCV